MSAPWGTGADEAGLSAGKTGRIGPSSFDVSAGGAVTVLDEINRRAVRWTHGRAAATALDLTPGIDDMSVGPDGTIYVLDARDNGSNPAVRAFAADGKPKWARETGDRTWAKLEMGPQGPVVDELPSEEWMPAADASGPLERRAQARNGMSGRPLSDGSELVVLRVGTSELRLARVAGGHVEKSWRILSGTPLGEVQLTEQHGNAVVVVLKTYTEAQDQFLVLVLDGGGVAKQFSLDPAEWAESAPLARFRLSGSSLYQLGSSPAGFFVDRFDLEVNR